MPLRAQPNVVCSVCGRPYHCDLRYLEQINIKIELLLKVAKGEMSIMALPIEEIMPTVVSDFKKVVMRKGRPVYFNHLGQPEWNRDFDHICDIVRRDAWAFEELRGINTFEYSIQEKIGEIYAIYKLMEQLKIRNSIEKWECPECMHSWGLTRLLRRFLKLLKGPRTRQIRYFGWPVRKLL